MIDYREKVKKGLIKGKKEIEIDAKFVDIKMQRVPIDVLKDQIFDKLSLQSRPIALFVSIDNSNNQINTALKNLESFKNSLSQVNPNHELYTCLYLGLEYNGNVNTFYSDSVYMLKLSTDNMIFFSYKLCEDLQEYGNTLLAKYKDKHRGDVPSIHRLDFSMAIKAGLIPKEDEYQEWLQGFEDIHKD